MNWGAFFTALAGCAMILVVAYTVGWMAEKRWNPIYIILAMCLIISSIFGLTAP